MKKKLRVLPLLLILMSIALTACSGDKNKGNDDNNSQTTEPTNTAGENNAQAEPTQGGNVVVGIQQDLDSLDPHLAVAAGTKEVLFNVYEGLVKPDKDGNLVPAVASEYTVSTDGKQYTFVLRDGIKFHNGELVTVEDIVYSIKKSAGFFQDIVPKEKVDSALRNIKEVTAVDEKTVEIKLENPDTELLAYLTVAIVPAKNTDLASAPIGTGPFKFVSYKPLESFVVAKNEEYWGQKAYLDEVTFKIVANTDSAFLELKSGSIDLYPYLTSDQAAQLKGTFNILEGTMNLVQGLFLNNAKEPFTNQKVREAMNYAINKQQIIDMVGDGVGNVIGSNMSAGFKKYYVESLKELYPYDVAKAKTLLTEAGYPNGFEFTITVPANYQFHVDTAQIIKEQLREANITANIQLIEWSAWLSDVYSGRNYESTIVGLDSNLSPKNGLQKFISDGGKNFINFNSKEYDEVFEKATTSVSDEEKVTYYKELQTILAKNSASVYIQDPALLVAMNKELAGYEFYPVYVMDMSTVYYKK